MPRHERDRDDKNSLINRAQQTFNKPTPKTKDTQFNVPMKPKGNPLTNTPATRDPQFNVPTVPAADQKKPTPVTPLPKVEAPVITPPKITDEQKKEGILPNVDAIKAPSLSPVKPVATERVDIPANVAPSKAGFSGAALPKDIEAETYMADKVDPEASQAEAAMTDYKAKVDAAVGTTPEEALVSNQLEELTNGLESGQIPSWAQGAVEQVDAQLASRGLSRSSIGTGDLNRAILAAALPVAQSNAAAVQQTNIQNLQNEQRANEMTAQLQTNVELANLSNEQQTVLANQASKQAIMLSNQSADNAAKQFNAQSQNQVNTFMANLKSQTEQFNAAQANAMAQFNAKQAQAAALANARLKQEASQFNAAQANGMAQFNQSVSVDLKKHQADSSQKADMFNKQNQMAVNQANTQWRRQVTTQETQMQHEANMQNAQNKLNISLAEQNNNWQKARDEAQWNWQSAENAKSRNTQLIINSKNNKAAADAAKIQAEAAKEVGWANSIGALTGAVIGGLLDKE